MTEMTEPKGPELPVPNPCFGEPEAKEALRLWRTADGRVCYMVRAAVWGDPFRWGTALADVIRYIGQCAERQGLEFQADGCEPEKVSAQQVSARILEGVQAELESPTDTPKDWKADA